MLLLLLVVSNDGTLGVLECSLLDLGGRLTGVSLLLSLSSRASARCGIDRGIDETDCFVLEWCELDDELDQKLRAWFGIASVGSRVCGIPLGNWDTGLGGITVGFGRKDLAAKFTGLWLTAGDIPDKILGKLGPRKTVT